MCKTSLRPLAIYERSLGNFSPEIAGHRAPLACGNIIFKSIGPHRSFSFNSGPFYGINPSEMAPSTPRKRRYGALAAAPGSCVSSVVAMMYFFCR